MTDCSRPLGTGVTRVVLLQPGRDNRQQLLTARRYPINGRATHGLCAGEAPLMVDEVVSNVDRPRREPENVSGSGVAQCVCPAAAQNALHEVAAHAFYWRIFATRNMNERTIVDDCVVNEYDTQCALA